MNMLLFDARGLYESVLRSTPLQLGSFLQTGACDLNGKSKRTVSAHRMKASDGTLEYLKAYCDGRDQEHSQAALGSCPDFTLEIHFRSNQCMIMHVTLRNTSQKILPCHIQRCISPCKGL